MLHIFLPLLVLLSNSLEARITLSNVAEFTNFVNEVNSGNDYSGTTVYLGSDVTLLDSIDPIGNDTYQFHGAFDGQGHIISNLKIKSSSEYVGLFGFSYGLAIRNVVLDDSCSIESTFIGSVYCYAGGFIGRCQAKKGYCNIENNVNMADVTFSGNTNNYMLIGGLLGTSGNSYLWVEPSGIVGYSEGNDTINKNNYIQNCLNYGTITHSGKTLRNLAISGIVAYGHRTYIENCVSAGEISTPTRASESNDIGSIMGLIGRDIHINYCYYTSDVNVSSIYGDVAHTPIITGSTNSSTDVNSDLVSKLNSNATSCNWSKWLLNANNATVTFKMSDDNEHSLSSQIILIPSPVKEGNSFLFWCKDSECTEEFDPDIEPISKNITLYAAWANNIATFDFGNGTTVNATFGYNTEIIYPDIKKEGYMLSWVNYHEFMPARDITVTAKWAPNNYTVTFDANGGKTLPDEEAIKVVTFDEEYGDIPEPSRAGYTFVAWFDEDNELVNETSTVKTPKNHVLYANWTANTYAVAFDADGGGGVPTSKPVVFNSTYGELPEPNRTGYAFAGWFTESPGGDPVNSSTIVTSPYDHIIYAHWIPFQYTITFDFGNGEKTLTTQSYGDAIIYPNKIPSKSFHKFREWCTRDAVAGSDRCNVTHVPPSDLTFTASFDVDSSLLAGSSVAVISIVLFVILLVIVLVLTKVVRKMRQNYAVIGVELDEEDDQAASRANERMEERVLQQMESIKISNSFAKKLEKPLKKVEKRVKGLDEILADLGTERMDGDSDDDIVESFRVNGAVHVAVASAVHKKGNLAATAEYLRLLYTAVRGQEEYEEFDELYFGMKDIGDFMGKMDGETISFGGVVSGFTSKRKAIHFLILRDEKKNNKGGNNAPGGVLFKVSNGKGYRIGEMDEETDEVLFEINSVFKMESVREVIKDKFITATLSFVSPNTKDEMIKI